MPSESITYIIIYDDSARALDRPRDSRKQIGQYFFFFLNFFIIFHFAPVTRIYTFFIITVYIFLLYERRQLRERVLYVFILGGGENVFRTSYSPHDHKLLLLFFLKKNYPTVHNN